MEEYSPFFKDRPPDDEESENQHISYHCFPSDPDAKRKWERNIPREN